MLPVASTTASGATKIEEGQHSPFPHSLAGTARERRDKPIGQSRVSEDGISVVRQMDVEGEGLCQPTGGQNGIQMAKRVFCAKSWKE
jgi:hypothetical protein